MFQIPDFEKLDELAAKLMKDRQAHVDRETGSVYYHGQRVAKLAMTLRGIVLPDEPDWDTALRLAGMFHDVGKGLKPHSHYGALIFRDAVRGLAEPALIDKAAELIEAHCDRRPAEPVYDAPARILQDADLLDHFGTYEIWMNINYQAKHNKSILDALQHMDDFFDHYVDRHRALLNYPVSVAIYDDKAQFLWQFRERLRREANGELYRIPDVP